MASDDALITSGPSGRVTPALRQSAWIPWATPTPASRPSPEARPPMTSASTATLRRTCLALAPMARSSASSRVRCATRITKVLLMMNAPTSRATPANTFMKTAKKSASSLLRLAFSASSAVPVTTSRPSAAGRAEPGPDRRGDLGLADAGRRLHGDAVDLAVAAEQPLGGVEGEEHGPVAGAVVRRAEARDADDGHRRTARWR